MQADVEALLAELHQMLNELAGEWRHLVRGDWHPWWRRIVAHTLVRGQGQLLDTVPVFAAEAGARVCARYGLTTYYSPQINEQLAPRPVPYALLLLGQNYVIAQDFYVSTLC